MKIPFTNINIGKTADSKKTDTIEINKELFEQMVATDERFKSVRPILNPRQIYGGDEILIPNTPIPLDMLYDVANYSDVLTTIHQNLRKEIFRNGIEIVEKFASKCARCNKEFSEATEQCDDCGCTEMKEPDVSQKHSVEEFMKAVNDNGQDLINVLEEVNDDLEVGDDGYLLFTQDYYFDDNGAIKGQVPVEVMRVDPRYIKLIADKRGRPGRTNANDEVYVCLEHRDKIQLNKDKCTSCGKQAFPAYFRSQEPEGNYIYYTKDEVYHRSKYKPSLTYGFSRIFSVWMKVVTLMNMDSYIKNYYSKQRPPRGLLFVNTPNMDSLTKAWNWMTDEFKKNPHQIPPIAIEQTAGTKGNMVNFIDFMKSPEDMQFIEMRNEYRRQIGAAYGVMPIFQADVAASGGLNNEGLQITVTNRAIKDGQGVYNDGFLPFICEVLRITDYELIVKPSEEQDNVAKEDLFAKKIANATQLQQMGFEVTLTNELNFEFGPLDEPVQKQDPFGQGGMGAGLPGQQPPMGDQMPPEQPPGQDMSSDGFEGAPPMPPEDFQRMKKGITYLREGQQAPKGVSVESGKNGGKFYRTQVRQTRQSLAEKPVEEMSQEERDQVEGYMNDDTVQYTAQDLDSAKRWLSTKPMLRSKLGSKYYEFAVQVASAINQGYDPEEIDWASLDTQIPLSQSLASMRTGDVNASKKKPKASLQDIKKYVDNLKRKK